MKSELAIPSTVHLFFLFLNSPQPLGEFHHIKFAPFKNLTGYMISRLLLQLTYMQKALILEAQKTSGYAKFY